MPRALPHQVTTPIVAVLARLGVTPNMPTVAWLVGDRWDRISQRVIAYYERLLQEKHPREDATSRLVEA